MTYDAVADPPAMVAPPDASSRDRPVVLVLGRFGAMACVLLAAPVIARALGPDGRGMTATALAVLAVLPVVVGLGMPLAIRRRLAVGASARADLVRTGRLLAALTLVPSVVLALTLEPLLLPGLEPASRVAFGVSAALVPFSVSWSIDANVLLVERRFRALAMLSVVHGAVSTVIVLATWWGGSLGVPTVIYAFLAGNVVAFLLGLVLVHERGGRVSGVTDVAREGMSLVGGQLAEILSGRVAQVVALPLIGASGAGLYSVAVTTGSLSAPVPEAFGNSAFARLAGDADRGTLIAALRGGSGLALTSAASVAAAGWFLIPVVFGAAFADARPLALLVGLTTWFNGLAGIGGAALAARRQGRRMTIARATGLGVTVVLVGFGARHGATGLASAVALGSLVSCAVTLRLLGVGPTGGLPLPRDVVRGVREMLGRGQ
ncbi:lipopolysaccharide biosynthesis protein [Actinotalea solisilvae]|uniref:lipopolysaccharide biosynthesis protein n=1 Tax=Actinotalea solisilvae TaxID=2072922 RepID=UPI0018F17263|nr:oligosaccharide flippase family protein [Actinotalea solisilvae]